MSAYPPPDRFGVVELTIHAVTCPHSHTAPEVKNATTCSMPFLATQPAASPTLPSTQPSPLTTQAPADHRPCPTAPKKSPTRSVTDLFWLIQYAIPFRCCCTAKFQSRQRCLPAVSALSQSTNIAREHR